METTGTETERPITVVRPIIKPLKNSVGRVVNHSASIGDVERVDKDKGMATARCCQAAVEALTGDYRPRLVRFRDEVRVVYRDLNGWQAQRFDHLGHVACGGSYTWGRGLAKANDDAMFACLQNAWRPEDGLSLLDQCPVGYRDEFESWCRFQVRYAAARSHGMSDEDCHNYAGKNPAHPEVWAQELPEVPVAT